MGNRSTGFKFLAIILLIIVAGLQLLSMKQSDRLYERVNNLERKIDKLPSISASSGAAAASENDGDWLISRIGAEPPTLNPITARDYYATVICIGIGSTPPNIFESLLTADADTGELKPLLAKSWQVSQDGLTIDFTLRDDIHFSDNTPITADDVVFSFSLIKNPKIDNAHLASYFQDVVSCAKIDGLQVRFTMSQVYFKSLEIVGSMSIVPRHIYGFTDETQFNEHRSNPIGSGPYVFEKWEVGSYISLVRNENYWGKKPQIKKLVFKVITNDLAALSSMRSHQIDFISPMQPEQFLKLSADEEFLKEYSPVSYWSPSEGYSYIGWNMTSEFFNDAKVRLAMTHLVDRESIRDNISAGMTKIVIGPFYHSSPQYNKNLQPWPYDPKEAARLLDEAGWKDSDGDGIRDKNGRAFRFKFLITSGNDTRERIIKLLKDDFAKVGIEIVPDAYEWSVFIQRVMNKEFDATILGWTGVMEADPYQVWHSSQTAGGGCNRIGFNNPQADALIEQARRTLDKDKRNELYYRLQEILHNEQPYTFMFAAPTLGFVSKRFENVQAHTLGVNIHKWYVPAEKQRYKD